MDAIGSRVTLHVVSSIDGFIARKDNSISWMDSPGDVYEKGIADADTSDPLQPIDCFVLGSRTYEHALELGWPYGDTPTIVLTSRELPSTRNTVEFHSGDPKILMDKVLAPRYKNIWLVGGAAVSQSFLRLGLVNEINLVVAPVLLGDGLRLFTECGAETKWNLKHIAGYKNGFVAMVYERPSPKI